MSRMLLVLKEHTTRAQYEQACHYAARGNIAAIETMYRKVVGQ